MKYYSNLGVGEFLVEASEIFKGDRLLVTGPTTGAVYFNASEIRYDLNPVDKAEKGWHISLPVTSKIRKSDKLFRIVPAEQAEQQ